MFIFVDVNGLFYPGYMDIALSVLAFLFSIVGIIGCIVPALPGVVLSYAGLLCAFHLLFAHVAAPYGYGCHHRGRQRADYFLPAWMTRRSAARAGAIGATVGVFAGFLFRPRHHPGPFVGAVRGIAQRPRDFRRLPRRLRSFLRSSSARAQVWRRRMLITSRPTHTPPYGTGSQLYFNPFDNEKTPTLCGSHRSDAGRGLF
ncbi:MAG: DUF456 domain-containing protein [Alistipes sp.]